MFLLIAVGAIGAEAIRRLFHPSATEGGVVMIVAAIGIVVNGLTALLFARGQHDINVRGAFLHMAADAAVSAAVVFAGLVIVWTGQQWVDPVMSLAVAIVILWGSIDLLKESVWMSLAGVPAGIDVDQVELALSDLDGVEAVHDLHIWPLSTTETALTAHIVTPVARLSDELLTRRACRAARALPHRTLHHPGRTSPSSPTTETAETMNVTHLECSLTGERYEAGRVHNLSRRASRCSFATTWMRRGGR